MLGTGAEEESKDGASRPSPRARDGPAEDSSGTGTATADRSSAGRTDEGHGARRGAPAGTAPPGRSRGHELLGEDQLAPDFRTVALDLHREGHRGNDRCRAEPGGHDHPSLAMAEADCHRSAGQVPQGRQPALSEPHATIPPILLTRAE